MGQRNMPRPITKSTASQVEPVESSQACGTLNPGWRFLETSLPSNNQQPLYPLYFTHPHSWSCKIQQLRHCKDPKVDVCSLGMAHNSRFSGEVYVLSKNQHRYVQYQYVYVCIYMAHMQRNSLSSCLLFLQVHFFICLMRKFFICSCINSRSFSRIDDILLVYCIN